MTAQSTDGDFDALVAALLASAERFGNVAVFRELESTNDFAKAVSRRRQGTSQSLVVVAWCQSGGRGRDGRKWDSGGGRGLWMTWMGPCEADRIATLPLRVGVALCRWLEHFGIDGSALKWPNDVVVDGRKLAGILCESSTRGTATVAACGVGLNFERPANPKLRPASVGMRELARECSLPDIAPGCIEAVATAASRHDSNWRHELDRYTLHQVGDRVRVRDGGRCREGRFLGFSASGHFRMQCDGEELVLAAGEIS